MDVRKRLGELLLVGFWGEEMNSALAAHIRRLQPAGLIFFKRNVVSPEQLAELTGNIQSLALQEFGRSLLLAIDQEGGTVARLPLPFTQLPDAVSMGGDGCDAARHYYGLTAGEMRRAGLNLNLAPVLDVSGMDPAEVMARRSFGQDPSLVAGCGMAAISAMQDLGIMATAKHFPGLGRASTDPHHDLPVVTASRLELLQHDLVPFRAAVEAGVACVMTSHTLYPALDPELPATFSSSILTGLLRHEVGFQGMVITDDLEMGAVTSRFFLEDAAITALEAGADLLLVCNDMEKMHLAAEAVRHGMDRGLLDPGRLASSLARVDEMRSHYLQ